MAPKVGLLVIATGEGYRKYANQLIESADKYFIPHDTILWTDKMEDRPTVKYQFQKSALGCPNETLFRYNTFLTRTNVFKDGRKMGQQLHEYDYLFYCDIDMTFVDYVAPEEILSEGITATTHPGYIGTPGPVETRKESSAYQEQSRIYFCGGFVGGRADFFLDMCAAIAGRVIDDESKGIKARWFDESHLNRYLYDNPPAKVLTPAFCYPDDASLGFFRRTWQNPALGWPGDYAPKLKVIQK